MMGGRYQDHLGVTVTPTSYDDPPWWQEAGPSVFGFFRSDPSYFGPLTEAWRVNFRVRDLDGMVDQLRAAMTVVEVDPETYPNGRLA